MNFKHICGIDQVNTFNVSSYVAVAVHTRCLFDHITDVKNTINVGALWEKLYCPQSVHHIDMFTTLLSFALFSVFHLEPDRSSYL